MVRQRLTPEQKSKSKNKASEKEQKATVIHSAHKPFTTIPSVIGIKNIYKMTSAGSDLISLLDL
jgi:hypothetical protein